MMIARLCVWSLTFYSFHSPPFYFFFLLLSTIGEEQGGMKIDFWTTGSGAGDELISPTTSVAAMGSLDLR
jgi:hypothetical protein